jgi:hypothetical protein
LFQEFRDTEIPIFELVKLSLKAATPLTGSAFTVSRGPAPGRSPDKPPARP